MKTHWLWVALLTFGVGFVGCSGTDNDKTAKENDNDETAQSDADKAQSQTNSEKVSDKEASAGSGKGATTTPGGTTSTLTDTQAKPAATGVAAVAGAVDVSYITEDFVGAVIFRAKQFLESPLVRALPQQDRMLKRMMPTDEINPHNVEQVTVLLAPFPAGAAEQLFAPPRTREFSSGFDDEDLEADELPGNGAGEGEPPHDGQFDFGEDANFGDAPHRFESAEFEGPTNIGFVARFTEATAAAESIDKFALRGTPVEYAGHTYYKHAGMGACAYLADRTVVVSSEELLKKMITSKGAQGPLIDRLSTTDGKADLVAVVIVEPLRELANQAANMMLEQTRGQLPPGVGQLTGAIDHLKAAALTFSLAGDPLINLTLEGENAQSIAPLKSTVDTAVLMAKGLYGTARIAMAQDAPPEALPVMKMADELVAGMLVTAAADRVTVSIRRPAGFDELPKLLEPLANILEAAGAKARGHENLRQIGLAVLNYHDGRRQFPTDTADEKGNALLSWRVAILPFVEAGNLYDEFHQDEPWDSEHNRRLLDIVLETFSQSGDNQTTIQRFVGPATLFPTGSEKRVTFANVPDGTSNTLLLVEVGPDRAVPWSQPADIQFDPDQPLAGLGEIPDEGFRALFCDGSVRMLPENIDAETMRRLVNPKDGKPVDLDF